MRKLTRWAIWIMIIAITIDFSVPDVYAAAPSAPEAPLCEDATNPTEVSDTTPEFSAIYDDPDTSDTSSDYQIQVSTDSNFFPSDWWNESWTRRRKITFNNSAQSDDLINFSVLVKLNSSRIDYAQVQNDYDDLRFIDADGSTTLDYEVETWNESGDSYVWVRVPQIDGSSSTDYIWMYYGNSSTSTAGEDVSGTWDSDFKGVWHFAETSGNYLDSTANANNGTTVSVTSRVGSGKMGYAPEFDGSSNYITVPEPANSSLDLGSYTIEAWVNADDLDAYRTVAAKGVDGTFNWFCAFYQKHSINRNGWGATYQALSSTTYLEDGSWEYVTAVTDAWTFDTLASGNDNPDGCTTDGNYIWVLTDDADEVYKYTMDGVYTGDHWDTGAAGVTNGFGLATNGTYIWAVHVYGDEVYVFNMDGTYTNTHWDTTGSGGTQPYGITTDGNYIWIADDGTDEVYKYNMNGTYTGTHFDILAAGVSAVRGIATDGNYIWVVDQSDDEVYRYTMSGTYVDSFDTDARGNGYARGITSDGNFLWVVDETDDEVYKYNMDGTYQASEMRLYRNGTEVSYTTQAWGGQSDNNNNNVQIGKNDSWGYYFDGRIDELRISAGVRSDDWIAAQHASMNDSFISSFGTEEQGVAPDMWDSGKSSMTSTNEGSRCPNISYAGTALSLNGATYYWRIKFWDNLNTEGAWSAVQNFTMSNIPVAPTALTALAQSDQALNSGLGKINLQWTDNSSNETGFKIERKTGAGGSYAQIDTVVTDENTYSDYGVDVYDCTEYYYKVRAYNANGDSDYTNEASDTTFDRTAPDNVSAGTVTETTQGVTSGVVQSVTDNPAFNWTAPSDNANGSGIAGYYWYFGTDSGGDAVTACSPFTSTACDPSAVSNYNRYYLRLKTEDNEGNYTDSGTVFTFIYIPTCEPTATNKSASTWYQGDNDIEVFTFSHSGVGTEFTKFYYKWDRNASYAVTTGDSSDWTGTSKNFSPYTSKNMYLHVRPANSNDDLGTQSDLGPFYFVDTERLLKHGQFFDDDGELKRYGF